MYQAITITYGDQAENHVGMQKIGTARTSGLSDEEMKVINETLTNLGMQTEIINLSNPGHDAGADAKMLELPAASVLIIRNGVNAILNSLGKNADDMFAEQRALQWDTKAFMYGRVVNKKARYNLCFGEIAQEPDYSKGYGRIIPWSEIPLTDAIRRFFALICPKFRDLVAEGNNYWDARKCGISFHGDTERKLVIAARFGAPIPLVYQWYVKHKPIGSQIRLNLNHGDIYIMCDKAVGYDWKSSSIPTLRHAAGAPQFLS